jgi:predicted transcriptional regulator
MRSASLKVNVTPDVYERLKLLGERQGQPAAVLAATAIGQYVSAHMVQIDMAREIHAQALAMLERMPQQLLDLDKAGKL